MGTESKQGQSQRLVNDRSRTRVACDLKKEKKKQDGASHIKIPNLRLFTPNVNIDNSTDAFKLPRMNDLDRYADELIDDGTNLPPELLLDKYHPHNDRYFQELKLVRMRIASQKALMKPKAAAAVYLFLSGSNYREIGDKLNIGPTTTSKYIQSTEGKRLASLINHHQQQIDGPNADQRKGILYRIVVDNERDDPNTAISAVKEINKMSGSYETPGSGSQGNTINIQINADLMPKGALDVLPETYESKQAALESDD